MCSRTCPSPPHGGGEKPVTMAGRPAQEVHKGFALPAPEGQSSGPAPTAASAAGMRPGRTWSQGPHGPSLL